MDDVVDLVIGLGAGEQGRVKRPPRLAGVLPRSARVEVLEAADEELLEQVHLLVPALGVAQAKELALELLETRADLVLEHVGGEEAVLESVGDELLRGRAEVEAEIGVAVGLLEQQQDRKSKQTHHSPAGFA